MMHCTRLIHMGLELAKGEGFNIERTWDREFLLNIRNHKMEYDELIASLVLAAERTDAKKVLTHT